MTTQNNKRRALVENSVRALENENGRLTPEGVVGSARDPASPLHGEFEWDDVKAGHAHRLDQARALIRSIKIVITLEKSTIAAPYYVRDPEVPKNEQGYVALDQIQKEPNNAAAMVNYEFSQAHSHLTRAEEIADALGMRAEVSKATKAVVAAKKKVGKRAASAK